MEKQGERLNPLNDFLFLKYMGEKGDEEQLLSFLNAVLKKEGAEPLASVEIIGNRTLSAEVIGDKSSILDVRAITADGAKVNIEVQLRNTGNMGKRSLFYWSREYSRGIDSGQDYAELPRVIAINIVNFEYLEIEVFHTCFHLWEDHHRYQLTDALEIHFIDMVKYKRYREKDIHHDPLHRWLTFMDKETGEETIKEVTAMDIGIWKAQEKIRHISKDKEALHEYHLREMALSDWTSAVNFHHREGMQEGIKEGIKEGRLLEKENMILKSRRKGYSMELMRDITGLTEPEIMEILKRNEQCQRD
ncbi:MAG: Rpn family recombination-promoting nuclease/putative transposase [Tannerella sp.]|jgi:predicted transposase/invertase (TIGR01784 family)|nr:Rpn family recombination-promoting nuclease/putative transposase [Tannerella sp.]